jgi:hypothetical protein
VGIGVEIPLGEKNVLSVVEREKSLHPIISASEREFARERHGGRLLVLARPIPATLSKEALAPSRIFSTKPWIIVSATFVLAAAATFAGIYLYTNSLTASSMRGMLSHMVSDTGLNMQVEGRDDKLIVSWNLQMPAVRSARYGVLSIDDGAKHRDINLLPNEVANGSILYKHVSDDVTFRLEIYNDKGAPITGLVRVLDASTLPASAVTNTKQLSRTPTNISQSAIERREQRASTKANQLNYPLAQQI